MTRAASRRLMVAGSLGRLAYAGGLLLAPDQMARRRLAADVADPVARMTTRAFGAVHVNVALFSLLAARSEDPTAALRLNIACDVGDGAAGLLEYWRGDLPAWAALANVAVQTVGMAASITALRNL